MYLAVCASVTDVKPIVIDHTGWSNDWECLLDSINNWESKLPKNQVFFFFTFFVPKIGVCL